MATFRTGEKLNKYLEALKDQVQLLKVRSTEKLDELRQKDL